MRYAAADREPSVAVTLETAEKRHDVANATVMQTIDERVATKKAELDALRPSSRANLAVLASWYDVELTYTSNAIEGNTLTRSETAIVLQDGITIGGKSLRDHMEALGHRDALGYIRELARTSEPVRELDVRRIHELVMGRSDPDEAGAYSRHQRMIAGSALTLPSPFEIAPLMAAFVSWLASAPIAAETAIAAHARFETIHPFSDGNGRTGRLIMNLLLLRAGYPPIVIGPEHRVAYITTLESLQVRGEREGYDAFMTQRLEASLDHYASILRSGR